MSKSNSFNDKSIYFFSGVLITIYLSIGFVPNLKAVDKIAPQWLILSILNLITSSFLISKRSFFDKEIRSIIYSSLSLLYFGFIIWAGFSWFYAINKTEVLVNISRQINVFLMVINLGILVYSFPNKFKFISWILTIFLIIEIYAVLDDVFNLIKTIGRFEGGQLKGITANRNITAFSICLKVPFIIFLLYQNSKKINKIFFSIVIFFSILCLTLIQSRASFIAFGLVFTAYICSQGFFYFRERKLLHIKNTLYIIIPFILALSINQFYFSKKGGDAVARAATISINTNDGSINQRLRYYNHVLTQLKSSPIFGVGLGNWKLKSIAYDSKNINGYVVPYHAHSDFIQLGAELGIIGFLMYLGIFILAIFYGYRLIRFSSLNLIEKVFLFMLLLSLLVYTIDANLNFPIARPQVLSVWSIVIALLISYYQKNQNKKLKLKSNAKLSSSILAISIFFTFPSIYLNNIVYRSLKGQMFLLQDFNSNKFNVPLNRVDNIVPEIPNITVTTIPINSVKARYYVNAKKYDKALTLLDKGTNANPYLYYSEILKSQIFQEQGKLDSAKVYARKAFFGLPNNDLHASRYINLINITRDKNALEEVFELLTYKNKLVNWKNYLIIANSISSPKDPVLIERAKKAVEIFPNNNEIKNLYTQIAIGTQKLNESISYSKIGLEYFNKGDHINAAKQFELAIEANPLDYANFENAATSNYLNGNLDKAIEQIDEVINDMNPLNGKCEYIKALIFIKMGDPIGACPLLATSIDSGFSQAEATFNQYCR